MNFENRIAYLEAITSSQLTPNAILENEANNPGMYTYLDVRGTASTLKETIPHAILIPLAELEARIGELPKDKMIAILPWSPICSLAKRASLILLKKNINCVEIVGGMAAWKEQGHEIVSLAE